MLSPELIALLVVGAAAMVVANLYRNERIENERLKEQLEKATKALEQLKGAGEKR